MLLTGTWAFGTEPGRVEGWYVEGLAPPLIQALTAVTQVIPISLAEWVEAGALIAVVGWLIAAVVRLVRSKGERLLVAARLVGEAWAAVALVLWLFYVLWGLAYSRPKIEKRLEWTEPLTVDGDELSSLAGALVDQVNDLYLLRESASVAPVTPISRETMSRSSPRRRRRTASRFRLAEKRPRSDLGMLGTPGFAYQVSNETLVHPIRVDWSIP